MFDEDGIRIGSRYTVIYEGVIFDGDCEGYNYHGYDKFDDALEVYHAYGDMIRIKDNMYQVSLVDGEWC